MDILMNARKKDLQLQYDANEKLIKSYEADLETVTTPNAGGIQKAVEKDGKIDPPILSKGVAADYWTHVDIMIEHDQSVSKESQSAVSWSANAGASWWMWDVGGSASHQGSSADAYKAMNSSSVKVSFDCMRVDITRPWLHADLFFDKDLKVAPGEGNEYVHRVHPSVITVNIKLRL